MVPLKSLLCSSPFPLYALIATWSFCDLVFDTNGDNAGEWFWHRQGLLLSSNSSGPSFQTWDEGRWPLSCHLTWRHRARGTPSVSCWKSLPSSNTLMDPCRFTHGMLPCFSKWHLPTKRDVLGWSFFRAHQCALNNWKILLTKVKKAWSGNTKQRLVVQKQNVEDVDFAPNHTAYYWEWTLIREWNHLRPSSTYKEETWAAYKAHQTCTKECVHIPYGMRIFEWLKKLLFTHLLSPITC